MAVEEHASAERKTPSGAKGAPPTAIILCTTAPSGAPACVAWQREEKGEVGKSCTGAPRWLHAVAGGAPSPAEAPSRGSASLQPPRAGQHRTERVAGKGVGKRLAGLLSCHERERQTRERAEEKAARVRPDRCGAVLS
jgi:hypothetical protein